MLSKFVKGKVAVFVDAANLFYSEHTLGWRIDFKRLADYLRKQGPIVGIYYYTAIVETNQRQKTFIEKLRSFGYAVTAKFVKLIRSPNSSFMAKGSLDIELALDAYIQRDQFDTFVLFSGDSDFAYLLDVLRQEGKRIVIVSTRGHISKELVERGKYIALPKLKSIIERDTKVKEPDKPAPEVH